MTITRQKARTCLVVNQLVCPGIGTIMAGRRVIGSAQTALMLAGTCMVLAYGAMCLSAIYKFALDGYATEAKFRSMLPSRWIGIVGFALCGIAWFWALYLSLRILHESRSHQPV